MFRKYAAHLAVLAFVLLAIAGLALLLPRPSASALPSWSNATGWLQTSALDWRDLSAKPTLVYFWSSSCERCVDGLPRVQSWAGLSGLNVVFVHSPEFSFERDAASAGMHARRLNVTGPVALDHAGALWAAYSANRTADVLYVVAANGSLLHSAYAAGPDLDAPIRKLAQGNAAAFEPSEPRWPRRIYTGYLTSVYGVRQSWVPGQTADYVLPPSTEAFVPYLYGRWFVGADYVRAVSSGQVVLKLRDVRRLYAVAQSDAPVRVLKEGRPLGAFAGRDVAAPDGMTVLAPYVPAAYELARGLPDEAEFILDVPAGFTLYRFGLED